TVKQRFRQLHPAHFQETARENKDSQDKTESGSHPKNQLIGRTAANFPSKQFQHSNWTDPPPQPHGWRSSNFNRLNVYPTFVRSLRGNLFILRLYVWGNPEDLFHCVWADRGVNQMRNGDVNGEPMVDGRESE